MPNKNIFIKKLTALLVLIISTLAFTHSARASDVGNGDIFLGSYNCYIDYYILSGSPACQHDTFNSWAGRVSSNEFLVSGDEEETVQASGDYYGRYRSPFSTTIYLDTAQWVEIHTSLDLWVSPTLSYRIDISTPDGEPKIESYGTARVSVSVGSAIEKVPAYRNTVFSQSVSLDDISGTVTDTIIFSQPLDAGEHVIRVNAEAIDGNASASFTASGSYTPLPSPDYDNDGLLNDSDNCPLVANPEQTDDDADGRGNACDIDADNDGYKNDGSIYVKDNCPLVANPRQTDADVDGTGDACESDADNDGLLNDSDNCPYVANPDQLDSDGNGAGDACLTTDIDRDRIVDWIDNCPITNNYYQTDTNGDGLGDACDPDSDNDGLVDRIDNCPLKNNADQKDLDGDGIGDVCDLDMDNDVIANSLDNCPRHANFDQIDTDGNGVGDACESGLEITVTATPDPVKKGSKLVYEIMLANNGSAAASQIALQSVFASEVRLVKASSSLGSCVQFSPQDTVVNCDLGDLAVGASAVITIEAKPMLVGDLLNTITVTTPTAKDDITITVNTEVYKK